MSRIKPQVNEMNVSNVKAHFPRPLGPHAPLAPAHDLEDVGGPGAGAQAEARTT